MGGAVLLHLAAAGMFWIVPPATGEPMAVAGTFEVVFEEPAVAPEPDESAEIDTAPVSEAKPVEEVAEIAEPVPVPETPPADPAVEASAVPLMEPPPAAPEPVLTTQVAESRAPLPMPPKPARRPRKDAAPIERVASLTPPAEAASPPPSTARPAREGSSAPSRSGGSISYIARLQAWLERHKRYPRQARYDRLEGAVLLYFAINRRGELLAYRIEESSGHPLLDEETAAMIRRAQPLPPMPDDMDTNRLEILVPILFSLRG